MFLLPDELFKNKGKTFVINFGKQIPWDSFDRSRSQTEWAESVKSIVYQISDQSKK